MRNLERMGQICKTEQERELDKLGGCAEEIKEKEKI